MIFYRHFEFFQIQTFFLREEDIFGNRDPPYTKVLECPLSHEPPNFLVQASETVQNLTFLKPFYFFWLFEAYIYRS